MKKRLMTVTAGRMVWQALYPAPLPRDGPTVKAAKHEATTEARKNMNARTSAQKLEQVLWANFTSADYFATLTYDDEHLPADRRAAVKLLKKYFAAVRQDRRRRGQSLKYVYVTENEHGDGRIHHHLVLNGYKDRDRLKELWTYGDVSDFSYFSLADSDRLAAYITKEAKASGVRKVGQRNWTPSLGLAKPKTEYEYVTDSYQLASPYGADIRERTDVVRGGYEASYIKYVVPTQIKPCSSV